MTTNTSTQPSRLGRNLRQFLQFGFIGGVGVLVNLLTVMLCTNVGFHVFHSTDTSVLFPIPGTRFNVRNYHLYAVLAFLVANLFNFVWNRHWTFKAGTKAPFMREFLPFLTVGSIAQAVGLVILTLLQNPHSPFFLAHPFFTDTGSAAPFWTKRVYWAQMIQVVLVMPINFIVNKLWTFRIVRNRHADRAAS